VKIAFFNHTLRLGSGIDTVITELASRLSKTNDVTVFCFKSNYKKSEYNFEIREIRSIWSSTQNRMSVLAPLLLDKIGTIKSELNEYDIVNTHIFPANYIVRNIRDPVNIVTEWSSADSKLWQSSLKQRLYVKFLVHRGNKIAAKKADVLLASSHFIKNWINKYYSMNPTVMHLDGINFSLLDKSKIKATKLYQLYPQLENKKIILFVGRITDHKNIHSLIEAFSIVIKKYKEIVLLLVGDYENYNSYYLQLKEQVNNKNLADQVIFTGVVSWEDLPKYYAACSIYATCSLWEGFLRPEAFAFEKPIVCFNTGPNSETVKDKHSGFLVENLNIECFAERLYELLENEEMASNLGRNGYIWAKENLDFDIIAENFRVLCKTSLSLKQRKSAP
jgi:1,2-diacylglycerol 3-alpha-glucosyltransferase